MSKKWTNERIDHAVFGRRLRRMTDVTSVTQPSTTPIKWRCEICTHTWEARVDNIIGKRSGCPACAGNLRYTVHTLQSKLKDKGRTDLIVEKLIDGPKNSKDGTAQRRALFRCVKCDNRWDANLHNVIKFRYGCPVCNNNISSHVTDELGNKFHSKLEYYFWDRYNTLSIPHTVIRQQRYSSDRRLTCDYVIPSLLLWIEISGTVLLARGQYSKTLAEKQSIVVAKGHRFVVLSSFAQIDAFLITIKDTNVV